MRIFEETQRFTQWWLQLLNLGLLFLVGYSSYQWFVVGQEVGNSAGLGFWGKLGTLALLISVIVFLYSIRLDTKLDEQGIHYRFFPFVPSWKLITWQELNSCHVRQYKPLAEYGGWGYRISIKGGKAFNIKGNQGIQLQPKGGKPLLLGTQMPEEAQAVIQRYFKGVG